MKQEREKEERERVFDKKKERNGGIERDMITKRKEKKERHIMKNQSLIVNKGHRHDEHRIE